MKTSSLSIGAGQLCAPEPQRTEHMSCQSSSSGKAHLCAAKVELVPFPGSYCKTLIKRQWGQNKSAPQSCILSYLGLWLRVLEKEGRTRHRDVANSLDWIREMGRCRRVTGSPLLPLPAPPTPKTTHTTSCFNGAKLQLKIERLYI